jgi:hypothetical protein
MALTRDNHFVPQLYLKNFASASNEVYEYRTLYPIQACPFGSPYMWLERDTREIYTRGLSAGKKQMILNNG